MADDVSVRFGAQTGEFNSEVNNAMRPVETFSARVKDLNRQLAALDAPLKNVSEQAGKAAKSAEGLSFATAGATREFIVIGHEIMTGNFSRIPGSMLVLAERAGGLHTIMERITPATIGWAATIGTAVYATYEWIAADEELASAQETIRGAMELNNQSLSFNSDTTEINITRLRILADVNAETAEKISVAFARVGGMSVELKEKLLLLVGDYAAATGKDAEKATEDLIKMFSDPKRGAEQLAATMSGVLSPAQLEQIELAAKNGETLKAQGELYNALASKIDDFRLNHLTPLERNLKAVRDAWISMFNKTPERMPGQSLDDYWKAPIGVPDDKRAAAEAQEHQNQLNRAVVAGMEVERQSGLLVARKNALLERQAALIKAANAASEQGNKELADRFRKDADEVGQQIRSLKPKGQRAADTEAKAAQREKEQLARNEVTTEVEMGRLRLENAKNVLDQQVALGEISGREKYEQLQKVADEEYALERQALAKEASLSGLSQVDQQRINNQMLVLHQRYLNQKASLTRQATLEERRQFDQVFQGIDRAFTQSINGILMGTQTWQQATANIFTGILFVFVDMVEKMASKWVEGMLLQAIYGKTEGAAQIATSAAEAGAAAYASTAAIPIVGPGLAPAAAAQAYANTMAFQGGLASFAVGAWDLPSDQVAQVHKGEMIIPRTFADSIRENGGFGGGGANVSIQLNAIDARSGAQFLKDNAATIAKAISGQIRNANPNLTGAKF